MKRFLLKVAWVCLFLTICSAKSLLAQEGSPYYKLSDRALLLYQQIINLEFEAALATSSVMKKEEPENLAVYHLENYIDFFELYITEDEERFEQQLAQRSYRLEQLARLPYSSPWRNFALAEVRLHWAMIKIRFESFYPAFRDINKANKLLERNAEQFPNFSLTYKDLGLIHAAVGVIPPQFKWAVELFSSLKGDVKAGKAEMELSLVDKSTPFYQENAVLYAFLQLHLEGDPEAAWETANKIGLTPKLNKLHCFVLANIAMRSGRNDYALRLLNAQPRSHKSLDFPYLDFMLGMAKVRNLDPTASLYFQSFLSRFNGHHFVKEAAQKIAWCELLKGKEQAYKARIKEVNQRGNTTNGGDSNADREAKQAKLLNVDLLKARLLFDGAYYERGLQIIKQIDKSNLSEEEKLELIYRRGRILHGLKDYAAALTAYDDTIKKGASTDSFFACNAALQAGLIEIAFDNKQKAEYYLNACLDMDPQEYKTGLHIQAKAALNRL